MRLTSIHPLTGLIVTLALCLGGNLAAEDDAPRLDVSTTESLRTSLREMSSGLSPRETWAITHAIAVLVSPDLWNWAFEYDPQISTGQMIERAATKLGGAAERKYWVHDLSSDELLSDLELLKFSMKSNQLIAAKREIAELKWRIAKSQASNLQSAKLQNADLEGYRQRQAFLETVIAKLEAL